MKIGKKLLVLLMAALMSFTTLSAIGCGGKTSGPPKDPNKQQIYIYAVDNGIGCNWIDELCEQFNALPGNEDYQVYPLSGGMDLNTGLYNGIKAKTTDVNIYFGSQSTITNLINSGYAINISDVYEMQVDGDGRTIAQKTYNFDLYKTAFSDLRGKGIYGVPYAIGAGGLLYDYDYFVEKGFLDLAKVSEKDAINEQNSGEVVEVSSNGRNLVCKVAFGNYEVGDKICTAGRDGRYGTYDDGQVQTYEEYKSLIGEIASTSEGSAGNVAPYIYTTNYVEAYTPVTYNAILAQNMGYENYINFMKLKGDIVGADGVVQATLTPETGYLAYETDVVKNAYNAAFGFYYEQIMGFVGEIDGVNYTRDQILHKASYNTSGLIHTEAQSQFITGPVSTVQDAAFLVEGCWYEKESKAYFNGLADYSTPDDPRGYGVRDYRYYLYPTMKGQVGDANKSVLACQDDGCGVLCNNIPEKLKKGTADEFIQKAKEFLAFTLKNESLEHYTKVEFLPRPFDYQISDETYAGMTKFQQNFFDMTRDTEHLTIVYPTIASMQSIVRSFGGLQITQTVDVEKSNGTITTKAPYSTPYAAFKSTVLPLTLEEYVNGCFDWVNRNYNDCYDLVEDYL